MDQNQIERMTQLLLEQLAAHGIKVEELILFGSAARGDMNEFSDIDLVIVSESFAGINYWQRVKLITESAMIVMKTFKRPIDIVPLSQAEYSAQEKPIARIAIKEGILLYAA